MGFPLVGGPGICCVKNFQLHLRTDEPSFWVTKIVTLFLAIFAEGGVGQHEDDGHRRRGLALYKAARFFNVHRTGHASQTLWFIHLRAQWPR